MSRWLTVTLTAAGLGVVGGGVTPAVTALPAGSARTGALAAHPTPEGPTGPSSRQISGDFDGDGLADFAVFRPSNGTWYVVRSSDGKTTSRQWGTAGDVPVAGDYDGDGLTDLAVWRPSNGTWYIIRSSDGKSTSRQWGTAGDIPVVRDFDGDGRADLAVWRPSNGTWYVIRSSDGKTTSRQWGAAGDIPD